MTLYKIKKVWNGAKKAKFAKEEDFENLQKLVLEILNELIEG